MQNKAKQSKTKHPVLAFHNSKGQYANGCFPAPALIYVQYEMGEERDQPSSAPAGPETEIYLSIWRKIVSAFSLIH